MSDVAVINGQSYLLSPLRCKHLRIISEKLAAGASMPKGVYSEIEQWMPFIGDSIQVNTPNFDRALLDEMTLQEFTDSWNTLVSISGIKVVTKGEMMPDSASESSRQVEHSPIQ